MADAITSEITSLIGDEKSFSVEMNGLEPGSRITVPLTSEDVTIDLQKVLDAQVFKDWVEAVDNDPLLFIAEIEIQSVDMFGPRVGFIKFKSRAQVNVGGDEGVVEVPGIVFMRGGAVGVLVILECEGEEHTIMTYQARVPVAIHNLPEVPAGMLDGSGNFRGVAADEIAEECDIVISEDELVDLTELAYGDKWRGMLPSAGGCDEFIRLYMFRREVERAVITELEGRLTGLRSEGERIKLHIVPLQEAWKLSPDAKLLSCLTLYEKLKESRQLPGPKLHVAPTSLHELARTHETTSIDEEAVEVDGGGIAAAAAAAAAPRAAVTGSEEQEVASITKLVDTNARMSGSEDSEAARSRSSFGGSGRPGSRSTFGSSSELSLSHAARGGGGGGGGPQSFATSNATAASGASVRHSGRLAKNTEHKMSNRTMMKQLSKDNTEMDTRIRKMEDRIQELEAENAKLRASSGHGDGQPKTSVTDGASKEES
jgi:ADP-sugar diphosphatase